MPQSFFEGTGGGIFNRGDIVVDGESYFTLNESSVSVRASLPSRQTMNTVVGRDVVLVPCQAPVIADAYLLSYKPVRGRGMLSSKSPPIVAKH